MKTGILGGSFDPVHQGHLHISRLALKKLGLQRVIFMPAAQNPLKKSAHCSSHHRFAMLAIALSCMPNFLLSDLEVEADGVSFTFVTLSQLRIIYPEDKFFLLLGSDNVPDFPRWKNLEGIRRIADIVLITRPGNSPGGDCGLPVITNRSSVSSTDIRRRIACGKSLSGLVCAGVERYIERHGLYRAGQGEEPCLSTK
ncbi:MAG: nicotinate (nicotinamide) nucleotide adenylyltransferase [Candidatus Wallbacteria bacterium]|nr:nicotinate (nicotinamide) nucleotide adenylyltransferase [Candidatus Wallbacteria bacterium]